MNKFSTILISEANDVVDEAETDQTADDNRFITIIPVCSAKSQGLSPSHSQGEGRSKGHGNGHAQVLIQGQGQEQDGSQSQDQSNWVHSLTADTRVRRGKREKNLENDSMEEGEGESWRVGGDWYDSAEEDNADAM